MAIGSGVSVNYVPTRLLVNLIPVHPLFEKCTVQKFYYFVEKYSVSQKTPN